MNVERVLARLKIEGRRMGAHVTARCPSGDHEDNDPSWRIRVDGGSRDGLHHCQSCGFGGDLFDLVMHVRGYANWTSAKDWLEDNFGQVTARDLEDAPPTTALVMKRDKIFKMPAGFSCEPMDEWPSPCRRYAESRGLTPEQVKAWGIGYALEGRLADRLVIPIYAGRLRSYVARAMGESPKRYLYPHEKEGGDLGAMFGEGGWFSRPRSLVVVTEGAFKSLAVERAFPGVSHAALGGSRLHPLHVAKLASFEAAIVFTDADAAGERVGDELQDVLGHASLRVRLSPGQDADGVGVDELRAALGPAIDMA
jgi:DNA primase